MTNTITKITHDGNDYEVGITSAERTAWNGKQDALTAGTGIDITNNTISSTVNGIGKSALFPPASSTYEGRIGYNTTAHKFAMCDGTTWTEIDVVPSSGTTGYVLTKTANGYTWSAPSGGSTTTTVTLASASWSSKSITVSATGVTASNTVIVSPAPANINDYASNSVYCSAQGSGTLTFSCNTEPTADIVVNVLIIN